MSLLTICQQAFVRMGLPSPTAVTTATDAQTLRVLSFANEEGQELAARWAWQGLQREASFTTVATEQQGTLATICGADYGWIVNETIWNRTQRRPIFGPKSEAEWQALKAAFVNGPWYQFRIRQNAILFTPVPAAGDSCYFEWISKNWVIKASDGTGSTIWTADADTSYMDERLMTLGIIWRWKQARGFDYAEDFAKYERAVDDAIARDGGKPRLSLNAGANDLYPGVIVPAGNWGI